MNNNKLLEKFLKDNNFDVQILKKSKNYTREEISYVVDKFGVYKNTICKKICMSNIVGNSINTMNSENTLSELMELFSDKKIGYLARCTSMLEYSSDNILQGLNESFFQQPITLSEISKDKYLIRDNGRHRCSLLKAHFLNELSNCPSSADIENLYLKYTIPVQVEELDIVKTYSKYLIKLSNLEVSTREELDNNYLRTGNIIIIDEFDNARVFSDSELVQYVKQIMEETPLSEPNLINLYTNEEYFKNFVDHNLKETTLAKFILKNLN